jgi:hypothetical protein
MGQYLPPVARVPRCASSAVPACAIAMWAIPNVRDSVGGLLLLHALSMPTANSAMALEIEILGVLL